MNNKALIEQQIEDSLMKLVRRIGLLLEKNVKRIIDQKKVNVTGTLKKSIASKVEKRATEIVLTVFANTNYAQYVNNGTGPHMPPVAPIRDWVVKKGLAFKTVDKVGNRKKILAYKSMDDYWQITRVAWAIAKNIEKKGTKGIRFFELALDISTNDINKLINNFDPTETWK